MVSVAILAQVLVLLAFCASLASLVTAKPNQRQGKSHDEVMKSKLSLAAKVAELRASVAASDTLGFLCVDIHISYNMFVCNQQNLVAIFCTPCPTRTHLYCQRTLLDHDQSARC